MGGSDSWIGLNIKCDNLINCGGGEGSQPVDTFKLNELLMFFMDPLRRSGIIVRSSD